MGIGLDAIAKLEFSQKNLHAKGQKVSALFSQGLEDGIFESGTNFKCSKRSRKVS